MIRLCASERSGSISTARPFAASAAFVRSIIPVGIWCPAVAWLHSTRRKHDPSTGVQPDSTT